MTSYISKYKNPISRSAVYKLEKQIEELERKKREFLNPIWVKAKELEKKSNDTIGLSEKISKKKSKRKVSRVKNFGLRGVEDFLGRSEVIESLQLTCQSGVDFAGLSEKQVGFLRDACDVGKKKVMLIASAGWSKTFLISLMASYFIEAIEKFKCVVVSSSKDQARMCLRYLKAYCNGDGFLADFVSRQTTDTLEFCNNANIKVLPSTDKAVRSFRADCVIIDEACSLDDDMFGAIRGRTSGSKYNLIRVISTPHGYNIVKKWHDGAPANGWIVHKGNYKDVTWVDQKTFEDAMKDLSITQQSIEYLGKWMSREGSIFDHDELDDIFVDNYSDNDEEFFSKSFDWYKIGVDVGKRHSTAITVIGGIGDIIYVLYSKGWERQLDDTTVQIVSELMDDYACNVYVEAAPIAQGVIEKLEQLYGTKRVIRQVYQAGHGVNRISTGKMAYVAHLQNLVHSKKIVIENKFGELKRQMYSYHYDKSGYAPAKQRDDFVDSLLHAVGKYEPKKKRNHVIISWNRL
ncbi:MAG: hypothetical protein JRJ62_01525 [Deltaproteobacteria bacterium]|nr:hypothetical protein [Deltaproteobacteria bacterium]